MPDHDHPWKVSQYGAASTEELEKLSPGLRAKLRYTMLHNKVLLDESPRAAAVLGPAYLDSMLEELLLLSFVDGNTSRTLLKSNRPLGSFAVRAELAYSLGLIAREARTDLDLLGNVRNIFAHRVEAHGFDDADVMKLCSKFEAMQDSFKTVEPLRVVDAKTAQQAFMFTLSAVSAHLGQAIDWAAHKGRPKPPPLSRPPAPSTPGVSGAFVTFEMSGKLPPMPVSGKADATPSS